MPACGLPRGPVAAPARHRPMVQCFTARVENGIINNQVVEHRRLLRHRRVQGSLPTGGGGVTGKASAAPSETAREITRAGWLSVPMKRRQSPRSLPAILGGLRHCSKPSVDDDVQRHEKGADLREMKRNKFPKNDPQGRTMSDAHDRINARPAQGAGSGTEVILANPKDGTLGRGRSSARNLSSTSVIQNEEVPPLVA